MKGGKTLLGVKTQFKPWSWLCSAQVFICTMPGIKDSRASWEILEFQSPQEQQPLPPQPLESRWSRVGFSKLFPLFAEFQDGLGDLKAFPVPHRQGQLPLSQVFHPVGSIYPIKPAEPHRIIHPAPFLDGSAFPNPSFSPSPPRLRRVPKYQRNIPINLPAGKSSSSKQEEQKPPGLSCCLVSSEAEPNLKFAQQLGYVRVPSAWIEGKTGIFGKGRTKRGSAFGEGCWEQIPHKNPTLFTPVTSPRVTPQRDTAQREDRAQGWDFPGLGFPRSSPATGKFPIQRCRFWAEG